MTEPSAAELREIEERATAHANVVAPKPKYDAFPAAVVTWVGVYFALVLFSALAGLDLNAFQWSGLVTTTVVAAVVFAVLQHGHKKHFAAWYAEWDSLLKKRESTIAKSEDQ